MPHREGVDLPGGAGGSLSPCLLLDSCHIGRGCSGMLPPPSPESPEIPESPESLSPSHRGGGQTSRERYPQGPSRGWPPPPSHPPLYLPQCHGGERGCPRDRWRHCGHMRACPQPRYWIRYEQLIESRHRGHDYTRSNHRWPQSTPGHRGDPDPRQAAPLPPAAAMLELAGQEPCIAPQSPFQYHSRGSWRRQAFQVLEVLASLAGQDLTRLGP